MQAEDGILNDCRKGQEVEQLSELFPHIRVTVLAQALIIEAIPEIKQHQVSKCTRCNCDAKSSHFKF